MINAQNKEILFIMLLVACLTGFASDIYAPSFLEMAEGLGVSIDHIQRSMSIFMLAVSISQLFYGPISEIVGRRTPLIAGLVIMLIGSFICFYAANIDMLLTGRFIQGLGAGACASLWRAIFRDSFDSKQIAKYGGYLAIIMVFIVAASPALGGVAASYFGWRASFGAIIIYVFLTLLLVVFVLRETSVHHHIDRFNISFFKDAFGQLITSPVFMGYSFCTFLTYGAFFSWFVVGPVILIENIGITPAQFGLINLFLGGGSMMLGGLFNGRMVTLLGSVMMLRIGWGLILLSGIIMGVSNALFGQLLLPIMVSISMFLFGATLIWPNAFAGAFAPFGSIAGYASSLYSCMQLGGGAIIGWISSFLPASNIYYMPLIFITVSTLALAIFELVVRKRQT